MATQIERAHKHVESMVPKADIITYNGIGPAWYGWALREAWITGYHEGVEDESEITESVNDQINKLRARVTELEDSLIALAEPVTKIKAKRVK